VRQIDDLAAAKFGRHLRLVGRDDARRHGEDQGEQQEKLEHGAG